MNKSSHISERVAGMLRSSLCTALSLCSIAAAGSPSFRSDKLYPEMGLKMRVLGNSEPVALAQPGTYTYTLTRGDETLRQERFSPYELWYASQHCGTWRDSNGNTLTIGRVKRHSPQFKEEHVLRNVFDQAMAQEANQVNEHDEQALLRWTSAFARATPAEIVKLRTSLNFNLSSALFLPVEDGNPLIYLFRVTIRTPTGRKVPSDWFCAVIDIKDGSDTSSVRKNFETQFLKKVSAAPRTYTTTKPNISFKELKTNLGSSPKKFTDTPARAAARKSIANMRDWWYAETDEYIFLSDIRSSDGKSLVRRLQHDMPHLRQAFVKLVPPFEPITETSVVRIFEEAASYKQYVGETMEWSIGAWSPMRRELVILAQGSDEEKTMQIIRHEGFHQYLFHSCSMITTSPWFNEGHACFFESAEVERSGRVEINENSRVRYLLTHLDQAAEMLPEMLEIDYSRFYDQNAERRTLNYTTAWALIYFLHKGAPLGSSNPYRSVLSTYLRELQRTRSANEATTKAFSGILMKNLQEDFTEFWKHKRSRARRYNLLSK